MDDQSIVVLITVPSRKVGEKIAHLLLEQKLAACVNIIPEIYSFFTWEGKINHESETLLLVKSRASLFEDHLIPVVQAVHPYELPEIVALPILKGLPAYLNWIEKVTVSESG